MKRGMKLVVCSKTREMSAKNWREDISEERIMLLEQVRLLFGARMFREVR